MSKRRAKRRASDHLYSLTCRTRCIVGASLARGGYSKKSKTYKILGCSYEEYKDHIESQFTDGMCWARFDEIHIDHRLPLAAANTEEEILVLNHHRNLQPMWEKDNKIKGDTYCPKELKKYLTKYL